jgi:hypothetical protein
MGRKYAERLQQAGQVGARVRHEDNDGRGMLQTVVVPV